jgi:transcriptional regulator with XRE-family HTH domain
MPGGRPAKQPRTILGERIVAAREKVGLTQQQLAEKLGTIQRVVSAWERRPMSLRPEQLASLADLLGVTTDYLLGRDSAKSRGSGPVGKAKRIFDSISKLPRHQQEKIFSILEPFVQQHSGNHDKAA